MTQNEYFIKISQNPTVCVIRETTAARAGMVGVCKCYKHRVTSFDTIHAQCNSVSDLQNYFDSCCLLATFVSAIILAGEGIQKWLKVHLVLNKSECAGSLTAYTEIFSPQRLRSFVFSLTHTYPVNRP